MESRSTESRSIESESVHTYRSVVLHFSIHPIQLLLISECENFVQMIWRVCTELLDIALASICYIVYSN